MILSAYAAGGDAAELGDGLIGPAMCRIGQEWRAGTLDVYQEHRATRIVESALDELIHHAPTPDPAGHPSQLAIGATPEGDLSTLPGLLVELVLRELGWEVINLGPNLPTSSLTRAVKAHRPDLVWLSVNHPSDEGRFLKEFGVLSEAVVEEGASLVAGGNGLRPDLRARMVGARIAERLVQLRDLARELQAADTGFGPGTSDSPVSSDH